MERWPPSPSPTRNPRRLSWPAALQKRPAPDPRRQLPRDQNHGRVGLELAGQDQPHASRTSPRTRVPDLSLQRHFYWPHGRWKSHLATALAHAACLRGHSVLFAAAIDVVNRLSAAESNRQLAREIKRYQSPRILLIDELGYLPLDKRGAELLFQVITKRYERGSIIITTNITFYDWPRIIAADATMTSPLLDPLLHHAQPVLIEGDSYRSAKRKQQLPASPLLNR